MLKQQRENITLAELPIDILRQNAMFSTMSVDQSDQSQWSAAQSKVGFGHQDILL